MVRIRLRRIGAKKKPSYRVVVANQRSPRNGRFIETIGTYNPCTEPESVSLQLDRASHWLGVGAQPSEAVARLLRKANVIDLKGKLQPEDSWGAGVGADAVSVTAEVAEEAQNEIQEVVVEDVPDDVVDEEAAAEEA